MEGMGKGLTPEQLGVQRSPERKRKAKPKGKPKKAQS
jgi:hypothetical protein